MNRLISMCLIVASLTITGVLLAANPEVFFSPKKINEDIVVEYVRGAKKELLIEAYSFTNQVIAGAVREKIEEGVHVRIICDKANSKKKNDYCLSLGGVPDNRSGLMHNKVMIRDRECVLTGSFNFTNNAVRNNRENFVILCDKETADVYVDEFEKIYKNNS